MSLFSALILAQEIVHFLLAYKAFTKIVLKKFGISYNKRFKMLLSEFTMVFFIVTRIMKPIGAGLLKKLCKIFLPVELVLKKKELMRSFTEFSYHKNIKVVILD